MRGTWKYSHLAGHPPPVEPLPLLLREPLDGSPLREVGVDLEAQGVDYAQIL